METDRPPERYREAVQGLMALLYADTPLSVIEQKACESVRDVLDADCAILGILDGGALAVTEACRAQAIAREDTKPLLEKAISSRDRVFKANGTASVAIPISYAGEALGAICVEDARRVRFSDADAEILEAFGQYVALARSNHAKLHRWIGSLRFERQVRWIVVAIAATLCLGIATYLIFFARSNVQVVARNARVAADVSSDHFNRFVAAAAQLAASGAAIAPAFRGSRSGTERFLIHSISSTPSDVIYGIGVWYQPYAFSPHVRLFGPYVHRTMPNAVVLTYFWSKRTYDYVAHAWYRKGLQARSQTIVTDPYFDTDHVYISAVHAIDVNGRSVGVVTVDSTSTAIGKFLERISRPQHMEYLTTSSGRVVAFPQAAQLLRFARVRHPARIILDVTDADAAAFIASQYPEKRIVQRWRGFGTPLVLVNSWTPGALGGAPTPIGWALAAVLLIWGFAFATIFAMKRARIQGLAALNLDRERARLSLELETHVSAEQALRKAAMADPLTGVANRSAILAAIGQSIDDARRGTQHDAVMFIDLNGFERINNAFGHVAGDGVLVEFGSLLRRCCRPGDVPARIGGDEFAVLIRGDGIANARRFGEVLHREMATLKVDGEQVFLDAGIGIADVTGDYASAEEVISDADYAMYIAKRSDAALVTFDPQLRERAARQRELQAALRGAVERNELFVEYQPIYRIADRMLLGFEALVRWRRSGQPVMYPGKFIPLAERTEIVLEIDRHVADIACRQMMDWQRTRPDLRLALNVSARHFEHHAALDELIATIDRRALQPHTVDVELTESALMGLTREVASAVSELHSHGYRLLLDDFGTGYSSLAYLQRLHVDVLKIDRCFVETMLADERAMQIVNAIVNLAHGLELGLIAEGVESEEQAEALQGLVVAAGQGFLYARPMPASEAQRLIA